MALAKRIFLFFAVNLLVMITISIILSLVGLTGGGYYGGYYGPTTDYGSLMAFCLIWGMTGAFISLALSRMMAKWMLGVQVIDPSTRDTDLQWLVQTVHRLANRGGITTMPEVGIYDSPEVNAFATGPTKNRSLVAVSSGLLSRMNRDNIEGVLGHEVTHICNGDMVTMTLLQGVVNAFVMFFARIIAWAISQSINGRDGARTAVYFVVRIILEIGLTLLGYMVVAAYSRYREYRADAGGAQLAGREKMVGALQALLGTTQMVTADNLSSFKISGRSGIFALMSTHPPLEERIQRLQRGLN